MRKVTSLSAFEEADFTDLSKAIVQDYVASNDLDNPLIFTTPIMPVINVTAKNVRFIKHGDVHFNYNVMSHDSTPSDDRARIVHPVDLFQTKFYTETPSTEAQSLEVLRETLLNSLDKILGYIKDKEKFQVPSSINYVFLSNLDIDLEAIDFHSWLDANLTQLHPTVNFQIGTSFSILSNLNRSPSVKHKYLRIVNKDQSVIILPTEAGLQAIPFDYAGLRRVTDCDKKSPVNVYVKSSKRVAELDSMLEQFSELINRTDTTEDDFQQFFLKNPLFLTGLSYRSVRSKIVLERDEAGPLIPDFFLEPAHNRYWDILDIKKPDVPIMMLKKNRERFSSFVHEAVAQLRNYGLYFNEQSHRERIKQKYSIECYNPRLIVVIGSKYSIDERLLKDATLDLTRVEVKSFDELQMDVMRIRQWMSE